jgi:hypothetical protein
MNNTDRSLWDLWTRRLGAFAVAGVAAYASYQHQRGFALAGGADLTTARLWPLSVDGLLVLSTAGLLNDNHHRTTGRARHASASPSPPASSCPWPPTSQQPRP